MSPKDNKSGIFHSWPFGRKNYLLFLIGVMTIVSGYVLMYLTADIVWAPVILIIGYCFIIPISIMIK
ncbi:MAG: hypothetical protein CMG26_05240 [Candidatus Marinimicrobia bacterium]|nr:hypothetical protein [Candidatus Neomarinimicrobiota bacterium]